jgi:hypothetical protein
LKSVCVFCGSSPGNDPAFAAAASALGLAIAGRGLTLVYGGGAVGLMGIVADAAMATGGKVVGIIPEALMRREVGHGRVTELHVVQTMHERKAMMAELSDGFIVLPGGYGTLEEAAEALTWTQLGIQAKGLVLLDVNGFWQPFCDLLDTMADNAFLKAEHRALAMRAATPEEALDRLARFRAPASEKWMDVRQT